MGLGPRPGEAFRGYHDLYMKYLDASLVKCSESKGDKCGIKSNVPGLTWIILPPDAFVTDALVKEGSCNADLCVAGPALSATTCKDDADKQACVDLICEGNPFCKNEWDKTCAPSRWSRAAASTAPEAGRLGASAGLSAAASSGSLPRSDCEGEPP